MDRQQPTAPLPPLLISAGQRFERSCGAATRPRAGGAGMLAGPAETLLAVHGGSRRVLLQGTQPPGGGFRAAKYFTYVFFALGVVVVGFFVTVCVLHCHRRRLRQRLHQPQQASRQQPYRIPSPLVRANSSRFAAHATARESPVGTLARLGTLFRQSGPPCRGR